MTQTHTPGPWELNTQDTGLNDSGTILGAGVVIVPDIYGRSKAECDANARLIAAAPELLEELKTLSQLVAAHIPDEAENWNRAALAAIAKAEGRA
jgi:hypothetical protein